MGGIYVAASIILAVISLSLIVIILLQKKRQGGFSGAAAGMGADKTYFDKNKGRTLEGRLERYTKLLAAVFMILALVLGFIA